MNGYPYILERNYNSVIVALSDKELGKAFLPPTVILTDVTTGNTIDLPDEKVIFAREVESLKYANAINDLLPKFIRQQTWLDTDENGAERDMLVMERLHKLPMNYFDQSTRAEMAQLFGQKMKELHDHFFVHGDLMRPTIYYNRNDLEWIFGNVIQTQQGLRLIDTGFSSICDKYDRDKVERFFYSRIRERNEVECFIEYYCGLQQDGN